MNTEEKCTRTVSWWSNVGDNGSARHRVGCYDNCVCGGSKNPCACSLCTKEKEAIRIEEEFQVKYADLLETIEEIRSKSDQEIRAAIKAHFIKTSISHE